MTQSTGNLKKRGLGRGLSSLMADINQGTDVSDTTALPDAPKKLEMIVPIERVAPNPEQPRRRFDEEKLKELSDSISEKGVIQPLIVRANPRRAGDYEIVAGERRWRASQMAKLHEIPVILREYDDTEVLEIAIIENIQRADLNSIEEAVGYAQLMEKFGHTQEQLSSALGKSRSHIANMMRLLQLPTDVQGLLERGDLTAGHARALITSANPSELARDVVKRGLSVRDTEKLAKKSKEPLVLKTKTSRNSVEKDADTRALEADLSSSIGMPVDIQHQSGSEKGRLSIEYATLDDLDAICQILSRGV
ncbi:ParB/RepB/Spo0J family partition protein [Celeribacter marinus]|uniref:ParB/RepB/Spo0J family partition protein n=1 Tax=Celeribacter marinus TaxID=1397108 RepID=UPI003F6C4A7E